MTKCTNIDRSSSIIDSPVLIPESTFVSHDMMSFHQVFVKRWEMMSFRWKQPVMLRLCCAAARAPMLRASGGRVPIGLRHASSGGGGGGAVKVNEPRTKKTDLFSHYFDCDAPLSSLNLWIFKAAAATLLLTGGGLGGAVAYASVDADFRKLLEESVPGSDQVMSVSF